MDTINYDPFFQVISFHKLKKNCQFSITYLGLNYFVFNIYIVKKYL
jgi:hypothetical protein